MQRNDNGGNFVIQGDVCWSKNSTTLETKAGAFIVCLEGKTAGVFSRLPARYTNLPLFKYPGKLIVPGLVDLHVHAPQFAFRGLGMDLELLDWLKKRAFPEESKYADLDYATRAYGLFVEHIKRGPNTRIVVYATVHVPATLALMDLLEKSGLVSLVGKVNMDRNCPGGLKEKNAAVSLGATREWLESCNGAANSASRRYRNTGPILTPRFIPSCSDKLMRGLGALRREFNLPVQSHLSENRREVEWVKKLHPASGGYGEVYRDFGLFGSGTEECLPAEGNTAPTVMAHCVLSDENEIALMAARGVFTAHCPQSNTNLSSGIAPVRKLLNAGVNVGLGSDIAGGSNSSIFRAMADTIQVSKLRRVMRNQAEAGSAKTRLDDKPLTLEEAFYLGTAGGGAFFGKAGAGLCGSFEPGCDFDALVINDSYLASPSLAIRDRLERVMYLGDDRHIEAKFVRGKRLF